MRCDIVSNCHCLLPNNFREVKISRSHVFRQVKKNSYRCRCPPEIIFLEHCAAPFRGGSCVTEPPPPPCVPVAVPGREARVRDDPGAAAAAAAGGPDCRQLLLVVPSSQSVTVPGPGSGPGALSVPLWRHRASPAGPCDHSSGAANTRRWTNSVLFQIVNHLIFII